MSTDSPGTGPIVSAKPPAQPTPADAPQPGSQAAPGVAPWTAGDPLPAGAGHVGAAASAEGPAALDPAATPAAAVQPAAPPPDMVALGTGRRKTSVARVRLRAGTGQITINNRQLKDYFPNLQDQLQVLAPLERTEQSGKVDIIIRVQGGGPTGQSGACKLGIARALKAFNPLLEPILREANLLTRDGRMKERKKYGLRGARRGTQFSKR